jgi:hypothetical protein
MELIDRYLHAVEFWLPVNQRADVIDELSDDLRSEVDERRAAPGATVSDDTIAAMLKERGHPMLVAARYLPQQYLIGPALLPLYRLVLRVLLLCILVPVFVLVIAPSAVLSGGGPIETVIATLLHLVQATIYSIGLVTIAFALIERYGLARGVFTRWDPRRLPVLPTSRAQRRQSIATTIFTLTVRVVFTVWWLNVLWGVTIYSGANAAVALGPVWHRLFWPILLLSFVGIAIDVADLYVAAWPRARAVVGLVAAGAGLVIVYILLRSGPWVLIGTTTAASASLLALRTWVNASVAITIVVTGAIIAGGALLEASRAFRSAGR